MKIAVTYDVRELSCTRYYCMYRNVVLEGTRTKSTGATCHTCVFPPRLRCNSAHYQDAIDDVFSADRYYCIYRNIVLEGTHTKSTGTTCHTYVFPPRLRCNPSHYQDVVDDVFVADGPIITPQLVDDASTADGIYHSHSDTVRYNYYQRTCRDI